MGGRGGEGLGRLLPRAGDDPHRDPRRRHGQPPPESSRTEASCATGPIYPVRTTLQDVVFPASTGGTGTRMPAGALVRTAGTYVENGLCDLWPIYVTSPSTLGGGLVDERVLAPAPPPRTSPQDAWAILDHCVPTSAGRETGRSGDADREVIPDASTAAWGVTPVFAPRLVAPQAHIPRPVCQGARCLLWDRRPRRDRSASGEWDEETGQEPHLLAPGVA